MSKFIKLFLPLLLIISSNVLFSSQLSIDQKFEENNGLGFELFDTIEVESYSLISNLTNYFSNYKKKIKINYMKSISVNKSFKIEIVDITSRYSYFLIHIENNKKLFRSHVANKKITIEELIY